MNIKPSVINTFKRVGIDYLYLQALNELEPIVRVENPFTGAICKTSPMIRALIQWVYETSYKFENTGKYHIRLDDFDRIRYFIAENDNNAYMTCID